MLKNIMELISCFPYTYRHGCIASTKKCTNKLLGFLGFVLDVILEVVGYMESIYAKGSICVRMLKICLK